MLESAHAIYAMIVTSTALSDTTKWRVGSSDVHNNIVYADTTAIGVGENLIDFGLLGTEDVECERVRR